MPRTNRLRLSKEEEAKLLYKIKRWYQTDINGTNVVSDSDYEYYRELYRNQQERQLGEDWQSDVRGNFWFVQVERFKAKLSEGRPRPKFNSESSKYRELFGEFYQSLYKNTWKRERLQRKYKSAAEDNTFCGAAFWKVVKPETPGEFEQVVEFDPRDVVVQDGAESIDDAERIHFLYWMSYSEIEEQFGVPESDMKDQSVVDYFQHFDNNRPKPTNAFPNTEDEHGKVCIVETWYIDNEKATVIEPVFDDDGDPIFNADGTQKTEKKRGKKYKLGRITTCSGRRVLDDRANDFDLTSVNIRWPLIDLVAIRNSRQVIGSCLGWQIDELQETYNDVLSNVADILKLTASPSCTITGNPGWDIDSMDNGPANVYPMKRGSTMEWRPGPDLPAYVDRFEQTLTNLIDTVGITAVERGVQPGTVDNATGIGLLMKQAEGNTRMWSENVEESLERLANILSVIYSNYYTGKQVVSIVGVDAATKAIQDFEAYRQEIEQGRGTPGFKDLAPKISIGRKSYDREGKVVAVKFDILDMKHIGPMSVEMEPDSSLPINKMQRTQAAITYHQSGLLEKPEAIMMAEIPPGIKERALQFAEEEREMKRQQMQLQHQQMLLQVQMGAGAPAGGPGGPAGPGVPGSGEDMARVLDRVSKGGGLKQMNPAKQLQGQEGAAMV